MKKKCSFPETDIYSTPSNGSFFSPFSFSVDPMEHLILINFEKDPDEIYHTFEFQQARKPNGEKSLLVIAYRNDGATDIYHQPLFPFASQASILNDVQFFSRPLEDAKFEINADRLEVFFAFEDKKGRRIHVKVDEGNRWKKNPFFLLAPVGTVSRQPMSFPVYSLYEMSFAKRKCTDITIEIDKVNHQPDTFPLPIDYSRNYFTRYSADTFNIDWNKNFHGDLSPLFPGKENILADDGVTYRLTSRDGHHEMESMSARNGKHTITANFFPPVPDIACLRTEVSVNGRFTIKPDKSTGVLHGGYFLKRRGDDVTIQLHPDGGWQPNEKRWILRLLFKMVKVFREWPGSYVWNAEISFNLPENPVMKSAWKRI